MEAKTKDLWVFIETNEDGSPKKVGLELLNPGRDLATKQGKISTSLLQRKIGIGYGKAAKFIDMMEELNLVSASNGQKPRDVLVSRDEWREMLARRSIDD